MNFKTPTSRLLSACPIRGKSGIRRFADAIGLVKQSRLTCMWSCQPLREVYETVMNKERVARSMAEQLITHVRNYEMNQISQPTADDVNLTVQAATVTGEKWTAMLGDSCLRLTELRTNSIDLSVYSPPFADLYTYSNSEFDLGNSRDYNEFFRHYAYIIRELLRVTKARTVYLRSHRRHSCDGPKTATSASRIFPVTCCAGLRG